MIRIVLTEEQTKAITGVSEPIDLVDSSGRMLGRMTPTPPESDQALEMTPEDLAEVKRRMADAARDGGTFYTTQQVLDHLKSLEQ